MKQKWHDFMHDEVRKQKLYSIIFGSDTPHGKAFDILLMVCITVSILITIFDSLFTTPWARITLVVLEYLLTLFFTFEYLARLYCSPSPRKYALSFFGMVDLISILPMYLGFFFHSARFMIVLRSFRLIRVFRIFKLFSFLNEGYLLMESLRRSFHKILVFFLFVLILVICLGTVMYMAEGNREDTQFTDIPTSIYWAIVTMTTVGYGDITPTTSLGRFLSALTMLLGYTIIAVPTGIVSASMISQSMKGETESSENYIEGMHSVDESQQGNDAHDVCPHCGRTGHDADASHCKYCGAPLNEA